MASNMYMYLTSLLFAAFLLNCGHQVLCCASDTLYGSSGTVSCPVNGTSYSDNIDVTWRFPSKGGYKIKFSKLDIESGYDNIYIYENADSIIDSHEKFRLGNSDALNSEFFVLGPLVVRFKTDGSTVKSGFIFTYETFEQPMLFANEKIHQLQGSRGSHPSFGSTNYSNNFNLSWSINVPINHLLHLDFTEFHTEDTWDTLKIVSGSDSNHITDNVGTYSGYLGTRIRQLKFQFSVTLIFETDYSVVRRGFIFYFKVLSIKSDNLYANVESWSGFKSESSFDLHLEPAYNGAVVHCGFRYVCHNNESVKALQSEIRTSEHGSIFVFNLAHISKLSDDFCIEVDFCEVKFKRINSWTINISLSSGNEFPDSLNIIRLTPESPIKFLIESKSKCRNFRHSCYVQVANGTHIQLMIQKPTSNSVSTGVFCSTTIGVIQVPLTLSEAASSIIKCRLRNGIETTDSLLETAEKTVWNLTSWTGLTSTSSFSVSVSPAASETTAQCILGNQCEMNIMELMPTNKNADGVNMTFSFQLPIQINETGPACSTIISCTFRAQNGWVHRATVTPQIEPPKNIQIDLINAPNWSPGAVKEFIATSESVCVAHKCFLVFSNGSILNAVPVKSNNAACLSSSTTRFNLPLYDTIEVDSYVACELANRTVAKKYLIEQSKSIRSVVHSWNGSVKSFSIELHPAFKENAIAQCRVRSGFQSTQVDDLWPTITKVTTSSVSYKFDISSSVGVGFGFCINSVDCTLLSPNYNSWKVDIPFPQNDPDAIDIEFLDRDSWNVTGVIQFRAVSDSVCPSVRHRCELRTPNGSSLTAQTPHFGISWESGSYSVKTLMQLRISISDIARSSIFCRLYNGSFIDVPLNRANTVIVQMYNWKQFALIGASCAAGILAVLSVIFRTIVCFKKRQGVRNSVKDMEMQQDNFAVNEIYQLQSSQHIEDPLEV